MSAKTALERSGVAWVRDGSESIRGRRYTMDARAPMATNATSPLAPDRILHAAILPWLLGTNDNARFLASRAQSFSLLEVGASHGLYALELAARFPNGSFVHLEPNGTAWQAHTALGVSRRLPHALFLRNTIAHEVAEALAHSNEFFDAQLLLSLQTTEAFAGIKEVGEGLSLIHI